MSDAELLLTVESRKKSGLIAALLNLFLPGAGYIYCGRWFLGIFAFFFVIAMFVVSLGFAAGFIILMLVIDGFLCAGRYNNDLLKKVLEERAKTASGSTGRADSKDLKPCPHCAELIRPGAKVCRFCNRELWNFV